MALARHANVILKSLLTVKVAVVNNATAGKKSKLMEPVNNAQNMKERKRMDNFVDLITATQGKN